MVTRDKDRQPKANLKGCLVITNIIHFLLGCKKFGLGLISYFFATHDGNLTRNL